MKFASFFCGSFAARVQAAALLFILAIAGCTSAPPSPADGSSGDASGMSDLGTSSDGSSVDGGCTSAAACSDGIDCTDDACMDGQCVHTPVPARCTAGAVCDLHMGGCRAGRPCATSRDCADMDPCTTSERCDDATRVCLFNLLDGDGDGFPPRSCGGGDCDDSNRQIHPGVRELCDNIDNNCDGQVDEAPAGQEYDSMIFGHHACSHGQGTCAADTPTDCGNGGLFCADLQSSNFACGTCARGCGGTEATDGDGGPPIILGSSCVAGVCYCAPGYTQCGGDIGCADLQNDTQYNCGACNTQCIGGACRMGVCLCPSTSTACPRVDNVNHRNLIVCIDLLSTTSNCGRCGNACASGQSCVSGVCRTP